MKLTSDLLSHPAFDPRSGAARPSGFADRLRDRTADLHERAEQSGIVAAIIAGSASRAGYALFMRNLLPAYRELEWGLDRHRGKRGVGTLWNRDLFRAPAIQCDLAKLAGRTWGQSLPLLPQGLLYARRVATAAEGDGSLLIAHLYTRYLGDLAGGQILKRRLAGMADLDGSCLSFYDFPGIADPAAFARAYRGLLDSSAAEATDPDRVVEEAAIAFQLNIELSEAIQAYAGHQQNA